MKRGTLWATVHGVTKTVRHDLETKQHENYDFFIVFYITSIITYYLYN